MVMAADLIPTSTGVLLAAAFDFEWIVIAMAFIAFVRWLIERITGKESESVDDREESTIEENQDVIQRRQEAIRRQRGDDLPGDGLDPNAEIRKFFEALGGQVASAPKPTVRTIEGEGYEGTVDGPTKVGRAAPPPLPSHALPGSKSPSEPSRGDELSSKVRLQESQAYVIGEGANVGDIRASRSSLNRLLASSGGLRTAIVINELFGPPRGLQSLEDSHKF